MGSWDKRKCYKYSSLVGAFLVYTPHGITWYWGNVVVYTNSYYRHHLGPDSGFGTPWLISIFIMGWTMGLQISGRLTKKFGQSLTRLLGMVLFNAGVFLSFWSVQMSVAALVVTMGAMTGLGTGLVHAQLLNTIVYWVSDNIGLTTAAVTTGFSAGSILINALVTLYINPNNLVPDLEMGPNKFFTQPELLENVPYVFVIIGCFNVAVHMVSFLLIRDKAPEVEEDAENPSSDMSMSSSDSFSSTPTSSLIRDKEELTPMLENTEEDETDMEANGLLEDKTHVEKEATISKLASALKGTKNKPVTQTAAKRRQNSWPAGKDFSPRETLKTVAFYTIWINVFGADFAYLVITNYFKIFGQLWIKDDHFLTNVGLSCTIGIVTLKVLWGVLVDKTGVKPTLIFFPASVALTTIFWYFTPLVSKWLYFVWTTMFSCLISGLYTVSSVGTLLTFGRQHFTTNYGLVMTSSLALNLLAPPLIEYILHQGGWFMMFFTVSFLNVVGLILTVLTFPQV
ncbi:uncharacterized protein LOC101845990 [Aplysia californica]|uniref:Uncharacterized protein LOC101845990 n=1 Tax=Aplysia californica TaxID=6500 RepID=A0ABM0JHD6_APLCA|nr:uncharacterized protein LOC101845990 [Aplysia californica]